MSLCKFCGGTITWPNEPDSATGKKIPKNENGTPHNCRKPATDIKKVVTQQGVGWMNVKAVKEISFEEVASHIISGWIIVDRIERMEFVSKDFPGITGQTLGRTETGNITRSVYIVVQR